MDTLFKFICIINQLKLKVMTANSTINCPKCDTSINVNEIITEKIKRSMKKDFFKKEKELKEQQESLRIQKKNQDEILQKKMKEIEKEMKKESIEEAEEIYHLKIKSYKDDLNEKNERLKKEELKNFILPCIERGLKEYIAEKIKEGSLDVFSIETILGKASNNVKNRTASSSCSKT